MSDIYRDKATKHAPQTVKQIVQAARDMAANGYSDHTIASILRLDVNAVRQILGRRDAA